MRSHSKPGHCCRAVGVLALVAVVGLMGCTTTTRLGPAADPYTARAIEESREATERPGARGALGGAAPTRHGRGRTVSRRGPRAGLADHLGTCGSRRGPADPGPVGEHLRSRPRRAGRRRRRPVPRGVGAGPSGSGIAVRHGAAAAAARADPRRRFAGWSTAQSSPSRAPARVGAATDARPVAASARRTWRASRAPCAPSTIAARPRRRRSAPQHVRARRRSRGRRTSSRDGTAHPRSVELAPIPGDAASPRGGRSGSAIRGGSRAGRLIGMLARARRRIDRPARARDGALAVGVPAILLGLGIVNLAAHSSDQQRHSWLGLVGPAAPGRGLGGRRGLSWPSAWRSGRGSASRAVGGRPRPATSSSPRSGR